ncbi:hypothetical protein [Nocardioides sp. SYSU DS0651]|uniref:hypothetical protein n=1 Tax=Nocardioides sp. SYSU DS0651 TaxID=3415955 RepID=UPI003F4C93A7
MGLSPSAEHTGNRVVDGTEVWVIEGSTEHHRLLMITGALNDHHFRIRAEWPASLTGGEELVEQILASAEPSS